MVQKDRIGERREMAGTLHLDAVITLPPLLRFPRRFQPDSETYVESNLIHTGYARDIMRRDAYVSRCLSSQYKL